MKSHKLWILLGAVIIFLAWTLPWFDFTFFVKTPGNILYYLNGALARFLFVEVFAYPVEVDTLFMLASLPLIILYFIACLFLKPPYKIRLPVTIFAALLIGLSCFYYISMHPAGARFYVMNFGIIAGILLVFAYNRIRPSFYNALLFNVLFFSWLAYISFPLIGEACC